MHIFMQLKTENRNKMMEEVRAEKEHMRSALLSPLTLVATRVESLPSYHRAGLVSHASIQIHKYLVLDAFD